jgi:hypothetical protein
MQIMFISLLYTRILSSMVVYAINGDNSEDPTPHDQPRKHMHGEERAFS